MLVHPLSSPEASQSARKVDADGNVMTGISNARRRHRLQSFSDFLQRGGAGAKAVLSGSVGDCCEEGRETGTVSQVSMLLCTRLLCELNIWKLRLPKLTSSI